MSLVVLAAMLAPAAVAQCQPIDAAPGDGMDCCKKATRAATSMNGDCCAMEQDRPAPAPPGTPAASVRTVDASAATPASPTLVPPARLQAAAGHLALDISPPFDRLYLRLSTIRR